jgi:hypothetical protein
MRRTYLFLQNAAVSLVKVTARGRRVEIRTLIEITQLSPTSGLFSIRGNTQKEEYGYYLSSGLWSGVILRGNIREMPLLKGVPLGDGPCTGIKVKKAFVDRKTLK